MSLVCVSEVHTALLSGDPPAQVCPRGAPCPQAPPPPQAPPSLQVRAELSDGRVLALRRTDEDLAWMMKKLVDSFPEDRETLSNQLLSRLLRVRAAEQSPDPEFKVQEINKLLTTIIHLPLKFSQSEPVRMFFGLDRVLSLDLVKPELTEDSDPPDRTRLDPPSRHQPARNQNQAKSEQIPRPTQTPAEEQSRVQSPGPELVFVSPDSQSDVLRCNGFCLANTETIFYDQSQSRNHSGSQSEHRTQRTDQSERGTDRRASTNISCLGHAPHCGLSHLIGRVVKRRSLKRKKELSS